ncbi:unnamed protein product [Schistosoma spindalis]|nr:unnamed protein product [Schistosoma spindale]
MGENKNSNSLTDVIKNVIDTLEPIKKPSEEKEEDYHDKTDEIDEDEEDEGSEYEVENDSVHNNDHNIIVNIDINTNGGHEEMPEINDDDNNPIKYHRYYHGQHRVRADPFFH